MMLEYAFRHVLEWLGCVPLFAFRLGRTFLTNRNSVSVPQACVDKREAAATDQGPVECRAAVILLVMGRVWSSQRCDFRANRYIDAFSYQYV